MAKDKLPRQTELHTKDTYLVLEEHTQRLKQGETERFGKPTNIVMRLNGAGQARCSGGFDDVGIDRSLGQPCGVRILPRLLLKDINKDPTDELAFRLGVGFALKRLHESLACIERCELHPEVLAEGCHDLLRLTKAQQPCVHKNALQLLAKRAVDKGSSNRRVDASGKPEDDPVGPNLCADPLHKFLRHMPHVPVTGKAANRLQEPFKDRRALVGMGHLRVELQTVKAPFLVRHRSNRATRGRGHEAKARRKLPDFVPMAHPYPQQAMALVVDFIGDVPQQLGVTTSANHREAKLAMVARLDGATQLLRHRLHAVADTKHRNAERKDRWIGPGRVRLISRLGPP